MSREKQIDDKNCNGCLHFEACCKWTDFPKQIGFPVCRKFTPTNTPTYTNLHESCKSVQVERDEIAQILADNFTPKEYAPSDFEWCALQLQQTGFHKQSEGCDFCKTGHEKCGTCVKFFDYYENGNGYDRCSSEYGNEKCAYYKPVHHCSNCGAKMKGGVE